MPFLITLTTEERRKLYKMGDKSLAFVTKGLNAAQSNPEILPPSFSLDDYAQDCALANSLTEVLQLIAQFQEQIDDTLLAQDLRTADSP
ncbi:hypothetical protein [Candidatus Cyanaurora vandensis]|uniref:hypothetical protein n=1 Tax=Candidatus Cyanaurora vandensis TaxID=2714958 RepID=UPI00257DBE20|nr:hypothetical protein [Candidatus Cyanaurora vandensis]